MSKSKINEIVNEIAFGDWSNEDINKIIEAVKYARSHLTKRTKLSLSVGDAVTFLGRGGVSYRGHVTSILKKNCLVKTPGATYRVPANLLQKAA